MKRILFIGLCGALVACGKSSSGSSSQNEGQALHPEAVAQMEAMLAEKAARTPAQRKISSQLLYAKYGMPGQVDSKQAPLQHISVPDENGRYLVDVKGEVGPTLLQKIEALGGTVTDNSANHSSARAWMPLDTLEDLASDASVKRVRMALQASTTRHDMPNASPKFQTGTRAQRVEAVQKAMREYQGAHTSTALRAGSPVQKNDSVSTNTGSVTSEGVVAEGVGRARKFYDADGTGVKVGVLSDSDDFQEAAIASGDLGPGTFTIPGQSGRPGAGEGTAMMEIVQDLAPGAQLFFATAFASPESFADNIRMLRFTYHCDIIADDVIYYFESPYQDDIVAQAVNDVVADGAMYFSSAGNAGSYDQGTSGTYENMFHSAGTLATLPSGYTVHDWGNGVVGNRIELTGGPAYLHWANPGTLDNGQATDDYDLFILSPDLRTVLIASTDIQDGLGGDDLPFEFIDATIPAENRMVIAKKAGSNDVLVRAVISGGEFAIATAGSTYGHNSAAGAQGVAAVDIAMAAGGEFTGGQTTQAETFSSDGYRQIIFDASGAPLFGGNGETRIKPNFAAADGVVTTLPPGSGLNPFFGTSAAAPHAGGVAALLKGKIPALPNWYITTVMALSATDIMQPGGDRNSGSGIVNAFSTLQYAGVAPAVFLELGTTTAVPASGTFIGPGSSGSLSVQLLNNGGALARNIVATLTTSDPNVTIINGTSTYANIAGGASGVNATPFTFSVGPGLSCGQKIAFSLSVNYRGAAAPKVFIVGAQTGAASSAVTSIPFTTRTLIPDSNAAGVNMSIPVSGVGPLSNLVFSIDGATCSTATGATGVGLDHSWVGDLVATLKSPAGTTITLFSRPGGTGNSGNNFCKTVLSDAGATSIQNIPIAGAPWTGTFKPATPLSTFNGENANGTWTLNVADLVATDTGSVRAISLKLSGFSCTP